MVSLKITTPIHEFIEIESLSFEDQVLPFSTSKVPPRFDSSSLTICFHLPRDTFYFIPNPSSESFSLVYSEGKLGGSSDCHKVSIP